jgi:hypothetical protein
MLSRLFGRGPSHPDLPDALDVPQFPERAGLPRLSNQEAAPSGVGAARRALSRLSCRSLSICPDLPRCGTRGC